MPTHVLKLRHTGSPNIGGGEGALIGEDVSFTLATQQDQTLFVPMKLDTTPKFGKPGDPNFTLRCGSDVGYNDVVADYSNYIVRRLTPKECERLQGFPDDWTKVPYRGKPAEECPEGPRYKACGNSMAVPVIRWLGERIMFVEEVSDGL